MPMCSTVFPTVSWSSFKASVLLLRYLIHFELILVQGERQGSTFNLLHVDIPFSQQHLFSPSCVLGAFVEDQLAIDAWVCVWIFYSDPLVFLSLFVPIPCCFYCYVSIVWSWVLWCLQLWTFCSELLWLFEVFCVSICFSPLFLYFCVECHWNFDRNWVEHVDCFWQYGHFYNVGSFKLWALKFFSPSGVFFSFSLQWYSFH
jgi:hypothetical protein